MKAVFTKITNTYRPPDERAFPDYEPFGIKDMLDNYSMATRVLYRYSRPSPRPFVLVASRSCPFSCVPKGTLVLMADMRQIPIENIKVGDQIIGVQKKNRWEYITGTVQNTFTRRAKVYEITTDNGTVLSTIDHPWLMKNRFVSVENIQLGLRHGGKIISTRHILHKTCDPINTPTETTDYKWGYLAGASEGDGCFWIARRTNGTSPKVYSNLAFRIVGDYEMLDRFVLYASSLGISAKSHSFNGGKFYRCNRAVSIRAYKEAERFQAEIHHHAETAEFVRGWLAGFYDAEGSFSGSLRLSQNKGDVKDKALRLLKASGFAIIEETKGLRLIGGLPKIIKFWSWINPAVTHKRKGLIGQRLHAQSRIIGIKELTAQQVYNLQTDCETFIADGFVSHNCTFCTHGRDRPKYRARSIPNIMQEIKERYEKYHFNILIILDELFAISKERLKEFSEGVLQGRHDFDWDFDWSFQTHASARLDYESLALAKKAGCYNFSYGLESASPTVIRSMGKHIRPEQIVEAIALAEKVGLDFSANLIFGDPAETEHTFYESMDFFFRYCQKVCVFLGSVQPYPGSKLFDDAIKKGIIRNKRGYYETINIATYNLTTIPNFYNLLNLNVWLERNWPWVKSTTGQCEEEVGYTDPIVSYNQAKMYKITAACPYCGGKTLDRHIMTGIPTGSFIGRACVHCGRRVKINL